MAGQQLPTQEERRQEVEQRSEAKLTDVLERVREQINKQLLVNISEKEREEERKRAQEQQDRLEQIQAASAKAAQALKEDETQAYHQWLRTQALFVNDGIPTRPMFNDEFEEQWQKKNLAIPAWDLGIFGTPQAHPVTQYKVC
jgi:myo-inositol-1-phosphate synthase